MATADELLVGAMTEVEQVLTINWETRTIDIPKTITNLGVESDDEVKHLKFSAPRYYHGTDLSTFKVRINYLNANQEGDIYEPKDVTVTTNSIEFTWIVGRFATMYKGDVEFNVCMIILDAEGVIDKEVNTTTSILPVLKGLETVPALMEEERDAMTAAVLDALERAQSTDLKGEPGYTPVKGEDYYTEAERNEFRDSIVFDANGQFANALRGTVSGKVVRVDDVCPVPHMTRVKIGGKNHFDVMSVPSNNEVVNNEDGTLTVNTSPTSAGVPIAGALFEDLTHNLEIGKTYTISANTTGTHKRVYFSIPGEGRPNTSVAFGGSFVVTEDILRSQMFLYASGNSTTAVISSIQIEEGDVTTEYEPYINPSKVTLYRGNKNLIPYPFKETTKTNNGVTFTDNGDGTITVNGTPTINSSFTLIGTGRVSRICIPAGTTCTFYGGRASTVDAFYTYLAYDNGALDTPGEIKYVYDYGTNGVGKTFTVTEDSYVYGAGLVVKEGNTFSNTVFKPQLEIGDKPTEFEYFYEGLRLIPFYPDGSGRVDFTPENFGTANPTMTLMTDTPGVTIEVDYSKDINKANFGGTGTDSDGIVLKDRTTGKSYTIYISNGKLMME